MDKQKLTREKLIELLSSARANSPKQPDVDCIEYDWKRPHYFQQDHQEALTEFSQLLAKRMAVGFTEMCYCQMNVEIKNCQEHFGSILIDEVLDDSKQLYVQLKAADGKVNGFLSIPVSSAMAWVVHLLQDSEMSPNERNELSSLEQMLLVDLAGSVIKSFSSALLSRAAESVTVDSTIITDKLILDIDRVGELYEFAFTVTNPDNIISDASIYIYSSYLNVVAGKDDKGVTNLNQQQIDEARMTNLNQVFLPVTAELGDVYISMSELLSLSSGDVVKMNKPLDESVIVKIKDTPAFSAWPVKSDNKYALLISNCNLK